jgi:hypothetical protein
MNYLWVCEELDLPTVTELDRRTTEVWHPNR